MKKLTKLLALLALPLAGCGHHRSALDVVVLVDISASIDGSTARMETAVYGVAAKLRDGDEISVIPICTSAYSAPALRFKVPEKREAFDEELARFRQQFRKQLQGVLAAAPCQRTAILDAIERAAVLERSEEGRGDRVMYVFTDGLEDAGLDFYRDQRLGSPEQAAKLAATLASAHQRLPGAKVRLGLIESTDFGRLPRQRQEAVVVFWRTYLSALSDDSRVEAPELLGD